ncbi:MAG: hypothetical protein ACYS9V_07545 [Planctomycetota bacterium]|jgi:hypothetical protein
MKHCRIVERSLNGKRSVDEQTFASIAVLNERLEISNHVKLLKPHKKEPAVC